MRRFAVNQMILYKMKHLLIKRVEFPNEYRNDTV
mgnify:CR=1 FL=1